MKRSPTLLTFSVAALSLASAQTSFTAYDTSTVTGTAVPVTFTFTDKNSPPPPHLPVSVLIPSNTKASVKAGLIQAALNNAGITANIDKNNNAKVDMPNLNPAWTVTFAGGTTGEAADQLKKVAALNGGFGFNAPYFATLDSSGAPSTFTGGFITDVGTFDVTLTSQQLADTSGQTVATALFQALEPEASAYGVALSLNGDEVDMSFDPNLSKGESGVIWGTTALTDGSFGFVGGTAVPEPRMDLLLSAGLILLGTLRRAKIKTAKL